MREKLAYATAYMLGDGLAHGRCFQSLYKDHVTKDDVSLNFVTTFFKAYLSIQTMEHLAIILRKSGVHDLLLMFPQPKRDRAHLEAHFKKENLPQIVDWYLKKLNTAAKEGVVTRVTEMIQAEESTDDVGLAGAANGTFLTKKNRPIPPQIVEFVKARQADVALPEVDLIQYIWTALMESVDWTVKPDQIEAFVLRDIVAQAPVLEPFCTSAKSEVALINAVQVFCYSETRIIKAFPQILKVLYNADCISDQAIIYWAQKGAKPQGKQHFIKATEPLVKVRGRGFSRLTRKLTLPSFLPQFLEEQDDESDEE